MSESNDDMFGRRHFEAFISAPPFECGCERFDTGSRLQGLYMREDADFAWDVWQAATKRCLDIVERYRQQIDKGQSDSGPAWAYFAMRKIREEIEGVLDNRPILSSGTPDDRA